ncbi:hypothetical protein HC256_009206 [Beauveria bassiana]|nr:hypothetical protein HC256_009206 [Beauveria bassiana]
MPVPGSFSLSNVCCHWLILASRLRWCISDLGRNLPASQAASDLAADIALPPAAACECATHDARSLWPDFYSYGLPIDKPWIFELFTLQCHVGFLSLVESGPNRLSSCLSESPRPSSDPGIRMLVSRN